MTAAVRSIRPRRRARRAMGALLLLAAAAAPGHAGAAAPPAAQFFANAAFAEPALSPDGRFLAVRTSEAGKRDALAVIDLEHHTGKVLAQYGNADIGEFQWVNDERLVYNVHDGKAANWDQDYRPGLFAVNRDGSQALQLARRFSQDDAPQGWNTFLLDQPGGQDSEWIHVQRPEFNYYHNYTGTRLLRLNTLTGKSVDAPQPAEGADSVMLDARGEPRLALRMDDGRRTILYRDPGSADWRELAKFDAYGPGANGFAPLGFGPDGALYVVANAGADTSSLYTYDIAQRKLGAAPLVGARGYDFDGELIVGTRLLGVRMTTDARTDVWLDPAMQALQARVDKALPGAVNLLTPARRAPARWVLVDSYSDVQPHRFLVYDTRTDSFDAIGSTHPEIVPAAMGRQQALHYQARDGLTLPALLTLPPGGAGKHLPMVVLVHGGPWSRGSTWGWDPESQFLATRGYAVLEIDYRGSTGFGERHFEAGWRQWGLAMQDDLADGARWAIASGIADPRRICIAGASYGGYAAMMGLVNDPDLYRCGIDWLGIADIEFMYSTTFYSKSDFSEAYRRYGLPLLVGDLQRDAARFKATSPLRQAERIRQPVLLAYGSEDPRVPAYHGRKLRDALRRTNKNVEWVEYEGEGHGWSLPKNRIDFWQRVERFLARAIGPDSATTPAATMAGAEPASAMP